MRVLPGSLVPVLADLVQVLADLVPVLADLVPVLADLVQVFAALVQVLADLVQVLADFLLHILLFPLIMEGSLQVTAGFCEQFTCLYALLPIALEHINLFLWLFFYKIILPTVCQLLSAIETIHDHRLVCRIVVVPRTVSPIL